mmetsp:Transcript_11460/g.24434  ORF Transcript_11460/g.24434 Transcript_11460/m.24434 type:complete len:80 (+) Transcript_11460:1338-1577(+)
MKDHEEYAHCQISVPAIVKDHMMTISVERLEANIVKPPSMILFFVNEMSSLQMKYLVLEIVIQAMKVLLTEMICSLPVT